MACRCNIGGMRSLAATQVRSRASVPRRSAAPIQRTSVVPLAAQGSNSASRDVSAKAVASPLNGDAAPANVPKKLLESLEPSDGRKPARIRIDGQWYDASGWALAHPAGSRWIHWFDGRDATAVFYALHSYGPNGSSVAADRLAKLPKCDAPPAEELNLPTESDMDASASFQEFRVQLEQQGFFKRNILKEAWALAQVVAMYAIGTTIAFDHPVIATIILSFGMQQAGWLAHDYIHGRGWWCENMRWFGAVFNGHSDAWWTQKHSLHHSFTNEEDYDHDIMMEPFFYLRDPKESGRPDSWNRKFQHIYGYPFLSVMFLLWRTLSIKTVIDNKDKREAALLGVNYLWMALCLPLPVAIGSVFLSGFLVAALVSATHQSEELMLPGDQPDYVIGQFRSTRDAESVFGPLENWLWGGMDTQLEHHLFPTMPRYNYHKLRPILKRWAEEHDVDYRISPSTTIIADNYKLLERIAKA